MSLDSAFFNAIDLTTYKSKYYEIREVDSLLVKVRREADAMEARLREAEEKASSMEQKASEYRAKGQALSREILSLREQLKAMQDSEVPLAAIPAEEKAAPVNESALRSLAREKLEALIAGEKEEHLSAEKRLDAQRNDILSAFADLEAVPSDLSNKIRGIADVISEINTQKGEVD